mgnify:CR=1 FL=1
MEKKELRKITREELNEVLEKHKLWLDTDGKEGEQADLSYTDLRGFNLTRANLSDSDLEGADLRFANLKSTNLHSANFAGSDLSNADLTNAILRHSDLTGTNMFGANLEYAYLQGAKLSNVKNFPDIPMACPSEGSFIGWKLSRGYIVKLEIPEDAKRSSGTSERCRCNKAKVLAIEHPDGTPSDVTEVHSDHDPNFIYKVGETVTVDNFDDNRFNEYAPGIHFYMDKKYVFHIFIRQ